MKRHTRYRRGARGANLLERVAFHTVIAPSGHWVWIGARDVRNGYGRIRVDGVTRYAHRVSYEQHVGPIPDGLELDHLCRYTRCVNPEHLEPVTPQVNVLRGESLGARAIRRGACRRGHPRAEFGNPRKGRVYCRACQAIRNKAYKKRQAEKAALTEAASLVARARAGMASS